MSNKSVNYTKQGSIVVKRSPLITGRKFGKTQLRKTGKFIIREAKTGAFKDSITANIDSIDRLLTESEKIMPRPQNRKSI